MKDYSFYMELDQKDMELFVPEYGKYIIDWCITESGNIWIDGITGGYIEIKDNFERYKSPIPALRHRIKHIKELHNNYINNR